MFVKRLLLRRTLLRMANEGEFSAKKCEMIQTCVRHPRMMKALAARMDESASQDFGKVGAIGDGKILEWLWENREEILEFIQTIIKLFS